MDNVWLLWDNSTIIGVYATREKAEAEAQQERDRWVKLGPVARLEIEKSRSGSW